GATTWLVNTGWSGGGYGEGSRIKLKYTRAIIDAIHSGHLKEVPTTVDPVFGLAVPQQCPSVPDEILNPKSTWPHPDHYEGAAKKLAALFIKNFEQYEDEASAEVKAAGPKV
ncbi:MAG: phosphoenolpyruvate carboxykinase (ATP), partial [Myxococcales bacterium]|nr:phosphoenolpyruvate carboxykinase (ATP) [Myxococcales bacterium]